MSEIGAGGSASLAISRCAISSLGLSRNSTVADFRFHSRKTGDFITTTITVELVSAIERAEKHKSPSTLRRDAARAQQYQQRRQSSRAVHQAAHHVSSQSQVSSSIGESKELPASSSSISAPSGPPSVSIQRPLLAKRARTLSTRVEAVNPPLLAPSSSSPASMALERPMSLNSSPTKETMTDTTSVRVLALSRRLLSYRPTRPSFLPLPLLPLLLDFPPLLGVYCAPQQLHLTHRLPQSIDLHLLFGRASKRRLQRPGRTANIACFAPLPISIYFRSCNCFQHAVFRLCFAFQFPSFHTGSVVWFALF
jgi:hypothetical protein